MKVEKIVLGTGDRMIRVGFGQNVYRWFFRIDLWCVGFRFTAKE